MKWRQTERRKSSSNNNNNGNHTAVITQRIQNNFHSTKMNSNSVYGTTSAGLFFSWRKTHTALKLIVFNSIVSWISVIIAEGRKVKIFVCVDEFFFVFLRFTILVIFKRGSFALLHEIPAIISLWTIFKNIDR